MEKNTKHFIKKLPSSPKINSNYLPNKNLIYHSNYFSNKTNQNNQYKQKTYKQAIKEYDFDNKNNNKKSTSHTNYKVNLNEKDNNYQLNNYSSPANKIKDKNIKYLMRVDNQNNIKKDILRNQYNNIIYNDNNSDKSRNLYGENNIIINQHKTEYNDESHQNSKDKKSFNNYGNDVKTDRNLYQNYKSNYINIWRSKNKSNDNNFSDNKNNTFQNINNNNNINNISQNISAIIPNDIPKIEQRNYFSNTCKINDIRKNIDNDIHIKNKEIPNINECISLENISNKLETKIFNKSSNNFYNFYYQKPKIEKRNIKIFGNSASKNNSKIINNEDSSVNNNSKKRNLSNIVKMKNIETNNQNQKCKIYNCVYNTNKTENNIYNEEDNNQSLLNQNNKENNFLINIKRNIINNNFGEKLRNNLYLETGKVNNITSYKVHSPMTHMNNQFNNRNINSLQNIIFNNNKNIFIQNNFINTKLNNTYNKKKNNSQNIHLKNYSYDLTNNIHKKDKSIKNLKNNTFIKRNMLLSNDKIKTYNIKDILLNKKKRENEAKEIKESKEIQHKENNNTINEIHNETIETIIDDSIIVNDSEVYGSITIKKLLDEVKSKDDKNKIINERLRNKLIKNTNNKKFIETITINYTDNNKDTNTNNQLKIEDMLKERNKLQKKKNNNSFYFKSFYYQTLAGKNYGINKTNQDMPVIYININGIKGFNIFGVLDGHGENGHLVSQFLSEYLVKQIVTNEEIVKIKNLDEIYQIMKKSNYELLINIFLNSDKILGKQNIDVTFSGTTCVLVIQLGRNLICANVGDSRAILIYDKSNDNNLNNTEIFELSHDLKPDIPEEKKRILMMGGQVHQMADFNGYKGGPQRVWVKNQNFPGLAMSRSLGDYKGKQCGILPLPEFIEYELDENSKYMVICSDGVWEFLSNRNVMEIGNKFYLKDDIIGFTQKLVKMSEESWKKSDVIVDDITAVVIFF